MWDNINNGYTDDNTPCFCPENMSSVITKLQSTTKRNCSGGMKTVIWKLILKKVMFWKAPICKG